MNDDDTALVRDNRGAPPGRGQWGKMRASDSAVTLAVLLLIIFAAAMATRAHGTMPGMPGMHGTMH